MLDAHIGPKERPRLGSLVPIEDFKLSSCTPIFWQSRTITISTYLSLFGTWGVLILAVCGAADVEHLWYVRPQCLNNCTPIFWQFRTITISTYLSLSGNCGVSSLNDGSELTSAFYNHENVTRLLNELMDSQNMELYSHILEKFNDDRVNQTEVLSTWWHALTWHDLTWLYFWAVVIGVVTTRHSMIRVTNPKSALVLDSFNYK